MSVACCINCANPELHAQDRCQACYRYLIRNRRDRTWEQIALANSRAIDRHLARRVRGVA